MKQKSGEEKNTENQFVTNIERVMEKHFGKTNISFFSDFEYDLPRDNLKQKISRLKWENQQILANAEKMLSEENYEEISSSSDTDDDEDKDYFQRKESRSQRKVLGKTPKKGRVCGWGIRILTLILPVNWQELLYKLP